MPGRVAVCGAVLGVVALVAVHFAQRGSYWDYSEGVYALTAQLWLHGADLYGHVVAAQPPGVFVVGAGLLAVHDGLEWLRVGVGAFQLAGGLIAGSIVWRLTESRLATVVAPAGILLTPWAVHEHGALLPELVALPFLLGGLRLSVEPRRAVALGLVCGLLPLIKVPLVLPAVVLLAMSVDRRRSIPTAVVTLAAGVLASVLLAGGSAVWRDVVYAQTQTGHRTLSALAAYWSQAGWNLLGLVVAAGLAWGLRARSRDPRLLRVAVALAVSMLATFASNFKSGTSLNIAVPVEAVLLPLALAGAAFAAAGGRRPANWRWVACIAGLVFTLVQSAALLRSPADPIGFLRPGSRPAWAVTETAGRLRATVAAARACRADLAFAGPPLVAMLAGRRMPDDQPDQFITQTPALHAVRAAMAVVPTCL